MGDCSAMEERVCPGPIEVEVPGVEVLRAAESDRVVLRVACGLEFSWVRSRIGRRWTSYNAR